MNAHHVRIVAFALLAIAMGIGQLEDPKPARPVVRRAGYRVLEADLHTHTSWSDGGLTPPNLVLQARRRSLDVIAVTEHNTVLPGRIARAFSKWIDGPTVIVGEEVTTAQSHILALGIESTVIPAETADASIRAIHAQGGLAIAAHPVRRYWPALLPIRDELDGTEVMHPLAYGAPIADWRWDDILAFYDGTARGASDATTSGAMTGAPKMPVHGRSLAAIGSSDYHWMSVLGLCRTLVFVDDRDGAAPPSERLVLDALRAHRTVVFDRSGTAHGDPALVAALQAEPYTPRSSDLLYRGASPLDRIARVLGFIGLVLLVAAKRPFGRREQEPPRTPPRPDP